MGKEGRKRGGEGQKKEMSVCRGRKVGLQELDENGVKVTENGLKRENMDGDLCADIAERFTRN